MMAARRGLLRMQASDGNLYGVTQGSVPVTYKITMPAGVFSVLANLPGPSVAPMIAGSDRNFYGTTALGGKFNEGTVFQLTRKGVLKIIYSFGTATLDGTTPEGPVMQGSDGKFYGTTNWGGSVGQGTIYQSLRRETIRSCTISREVPTAPTRRQAS